MNISEFVVKVSSRCNIDCSYCYEFNLGDQTWRNQPKLMAPETFRKLCERIKNHSKTHELEKINISFHGGEPLLLGINNFFLFLKIIDDELRKFLDVEVSIQTNGVLINKSYLSAFRDHGVALSISIDGPKNINDKNRLDFEKRSTFKDVISSINLVQRNIPELFDGVLSVINIDSCPKKIYRFFRSMDIMNMDFLLPDHNWDRPPERKHNYGYGNWLKDLYLEWLYENNPDVFVAILDTVIRKLLGGNSNNEVFSIDPVSFITISTSGEYQALDALKSVGPGYYETGKTVFNAEIDEVLNCKNIKPRLVGKNQLAPTCANCNKVKICSGGYFPHRFKKESGFKNPSVYCEDLYYFISEVENDLVRKNFLQGTQEYHKTSLIKAGELS